jgi:hypothetical protein
MFLKSTFTKGKSAKLVGTEYAWEKKREGTEKRWDIFEIFPIFPIICDLEFFKGLFDAVAVDVKPAVLQNSIYADSGYDKKLREFCRENGIIVYLKTLR